MTRKPRGQPVHGWLVLDKPAGMTSTQASSAVRRLFNAAKAGHAGTLDPLATGVLPVALGEATKTMAYVVDGTKRYRFTVRWGEARDTDDAAGKVIATNPRRPTGGEIAEALPRFVGLIEQSPPAFSAVHIDGERAYDLARAGRAPELPPRQVTVLRLEFVGQPEADLAVFEVTCGKGTYVRSLARDLSARLGTVGHVAALRRLAVGPFTENRAISLETLESLRHSPAAFGHLLPVETALDDIPALALTDTEANRLRHGQPVGLFRRQDLERIGHLESGSLVCAKHSGKLLALTRFEAGGLRPVRILNH
ncbi:MAG: tRNA pseudouridine(55) synthase TruB [Dongiaceae bacterium]